MVKLFKDRYILVFDNFLITEIIMNKIPKLLISSGENLIKAWAICRTL